MVQAVNDEDTGGMFKAVQARGFSDYLAESYGGDSYGLKQVCLYPTHYVGAWYLNPAGWGPVLLSIVMMQMNGQKVPMVTNITGYEVDSYQLGGPLQLKMCPLAGRPMSTRCVLYLPSEARFQAPPAAGA